VELRPMTGRTLNFGLDTGRNHYIKCMLPPNGDLQKRPEGAAVRWGYTETFL
jgi:hypothetical protein